VLREIANCRTGKEAPLAAVLTLRADFMGHALDDRTLAEVLKDADVKLGPMNAAELGEAVARRRSCWARAGGGLRDKIVAAVSAGPGLLRSWSSPSTSSGIARSGASPRTARRRLG
jgi:hypothetical protein